MASGSRAATIGVGGYGGDPAPRHVAEDAKPMQGGGQDSC